jgi:uroporphyrinogen-III decarboxylase
MGVNFDILEREGPVMEKKWNTMEDALNIKPLDPYKSTPYIADILKNLRKEVGNKATLRWSAVYLGHLFGLRTR